GEEMDKEGDERLAGRVDIEQRVARAAQDAVQYHLVVANHAYLRGCTFAAVLLFEQVHDGVNSRHFGTLSRGGECILLSVTASVSVIALNYPLLGTVCGRRRRDGSVTSEAFAATR